jgi:hypothetical protein
MKRYIVLALLVLALATPSYAGILEDVKDHSVKAVVVYDLDNHNAEEALGAAINKDVFGLKGVDLDLYVTGLKGEMFSSNDNKNLLGGLSYNYYFGKDKSWSIVLGGGIKGEDFFEMRAFEDIKEIELNKTAYAGIGKKF